MIENKKTEKILHYFTRFWDLTPIKAVFGLGFILNLERKVFTLLKHR